VPACGSNRVLAWWRWALRRCRFVCGDYAGCPRTTRLCPLAGAQALQLPLEAVRSQLAAELRTSLAVATAPPAQAATGPATATAGGTPFAPTGRAASLSTAVSGLSVAAGGGAADDGAAAGGSGGGVLKPESVSYIAVRCAQGPKGLLGTLVRATSARSRARVDQPRLTLHVTSHLDPARDVTPCFAQVNAPPSPAAALTRRR
jgi:hypothetical protein